MSAILPTSGSPICSPFAPMHIRGAGSGNGGADAPSMEKYVPWNVGSSSVHISRQIAAAGLVVLVAITPAALVTGADRRQASVHDDLVSVFADTTYDEIRAVLSADVDNPEPLDDTARFVDGEQIFGAISVRSNGARYTNDQIEIRWPALFFGFRRCVYVTWTPTNVEFRDASGQACTEFIG